MEEKKKIKFETSSGFCTTIIIQEIMVKKKKIIFTVYLPNFLLRALLCVHNQIGFRNFT